MKIIARVLKTDPIAKPTMVRLKPILRGVWLGNSPSGLKPSKNLADYMFTKTLVSLFTLKF